MPRGLAEQGIGRLVTITTAAAVLTASALVCRLQVRYWNNTETLFHHAIEVTTNNFIAHYNLGVTLWKTGRFQEAIGHYEQAVKILPSYAEAQNNLGVALTQMGRLREAIPHWEQAVRVWPDSAELHNNLGLAFWQLGRTQEGIGHFEYALRIDPQAAGIHYNLGLALRQAGRTQEAIAQWEQALRISPRIAGAHYELGLASSQAGNLKDAIVHYEQALRIQPNYAEAQNDLAWLLATLAPAEGDDPVRALTLAKQACSLTGNRVPGYLDTLAAAYAANGRFEDAAVSAQYAVELARAAGQTQLAREIEARLELYRSGHAYRQVVGTPAPPVSELPQ